MTGTSSRDRGGLRLALAVANGLMLGAFIGGLLSAAFGGGVGVALVLAALPAALAVVFSYRTGKGLDGSRRYWLLTTVAAAVCLTVGLLLRDKPDPLMVWLPFLAVSTVLAAVCLAITEVLRRRTS